MSLTEGRLTEASGMRGLEAASNRVREDAGGGGGAFVKYRTFNGTSDNLTFNIAETASAPILNPGTAAIVLRRTRNSTGGGGANFQAWFSGCATSGASGGNRGCCYFQPTNQLDFFNNDNGQGAEGGDTLTVSDGWLVCAISHVSGAAMRMHSYKWGGSWVHTALADVGGTTPGAGGFFEVGEQGGNTQYLAADVAVIAYWHRELSDSECATLHTSLAAWTALSPNHLWRMDGSPIVDSIGTANIRSITGTTLTTNDSPLPVS